MTTSEPFLFKIAVRQDICPPDCDEDFFEEIEDVKFTIRSETVDVSAGWCLSRESSESKSTVLSVKFVNGDRYVPVSGHSVLSCKGTHPYVCITLQRPDSIREALLINLSSYGLNHAELQKAWKESTLAAFVAQTFQKQSSKTFVIEMQVCYHS